MTMKNIKKVLISLTAAAVSAASFCAIPSASAASGKYKTYSYYFDVPENTYVKTCNANVSYNPNNVEFVRSNNGNLGGTFSVSNVGITDTSKKTYVEYSNASPSSQSGSLGFVTLKTTSSVPSFSVTLVKNDRNNTLVTSTVKVNRVLMGDVNLDGVVTQDDVTLLSRAVMGAAALNETQKRAADVDGNGKADATDALCINKYIAGVIDSVCD